MQTAHHLTALSHNTPYQNSNKPKAPFSARFPESVLKRLKLLIVEDNLLIQFSIQSMLKGLGCKFDMASNGKQAIKFAHQNKDYDLVFMDIDLPDTNGIEITKIFLSMENIRNVPIVAMTSHTEQMYIERCYLAGMVGFYNKPKSSDEIAEIIQQHVVEPASLAVT
jgi:CheY-like chemotaxis protein